MTHENPSVTSGEAQAQCQSLVEALYLDLDATGHESPMVQLHFENSAEPGFFLRWGASSTYDTKWLDGNTLAEAYEKARSFIKEIETPAQRQRRLATSAVAKALEAVREADFEAAEAAAGVAFASQLEALMEALSTNTLSLHKD